jgi:hypothetical protein
MKLRSNGPSDYRAVTKKMAKFERKKQNICILADEKLCGNKQ